MLKKLLYSLLFLCLSHAVVSHASGTSAPLSRQVTLLEASSSSEVLLETTGLYYSKKRSRFSKRRDVRKVGLEQAIEDAKKAGVYYLLFNSTDPILSREQEETAFRGIQERFFQPDIINEFITYQDDVVRKKVLLNKKTGIKVILQIKINKARLLKELENRGVLMPKESLLERIGTPFIMVLPMQSQNEKIETVMKNKEVQHAAGVIQSILTAKQYDVLLPDQSQFLNTLKQSQDLLSEFKSDPAYQLALSVGSDIYIDYSISASESRFETQQYSATIRAYETTTARLLASETGYSKNREGNDFLSIEEALQSAMNNIITRIHTYWKNDIDKGMRFKIITRIGLPSLEKKEINLIHDTYFNTLDTVSEKVKEILSTDKTLDSIIWVNPNTYTSSRAVWQEIRDTFNRQSSFKIYKATINRKLILLNIHD